MFVISFGDDGATIKVEQPAAPALRPRLAIVHLLDGDVNVGYVE